MNRTSGPRPQKFADELAFDHTPSAPWLDELGNVSKARHHPLCERSTRQRRVRSRRNRVQLPSRSYAGSGADVCVIVEEGASTDITTLGSSWWSFWLLTLDLPLWSARVVHHAMAENFLFIPRLYAAQRSAHFQTAASTSTVTVTVRRLACSSCIPLIAFGTVVLCKRLTPRTNPMHSSRETKKPSALRILLTLVHLARTIRL